MEYITYKSNIDFFSIKIPYTVNSIDVDYQRIGYNLFENSLILRNMKLHLIKETEMKRVYSIMVMNIESSIKKNKIKLALENSVNKVTANAKVIKCEEHMLNGFSAISVCTSQMNHNETIYSKIVLCIIHNIYYQLQVIAYNEKLIGDDASNTFFNSFEYIKPKQSWCDSKLSTGVL